jgi:hypothetical protein
VIVRKVFNERCLTYKCFFLPVLLIIVLYITIRHPESLLISEAQVLRACKMYTVVKTYPEESQPSHMGMERIKEYIDKIPESIWEEGCGPSQEKEGKEEI